jgi:hypothetical protein
MFDWIVEATLGLRLVEGSVIPSPPKAENKNTIFGRYVKNYEEWLGKASRL